MAKLRKGNCILFSDGRLAFVGKVYKPKQRRFIVFDENQISISYCYGVSYDCYPEKIIVDGREITIISKDEAIEKLKTMRNTSIARKERQIENLGNDIKTLKSENYYQKMQVIISDL